MRVRILGEGFYANVYARNMAYFGHQVLTSTDGADITLVAHEDSAQAMMTVQQYGTCLVVTPLPFSVARDLPYHAAYAPENLRRSDPDNSLRDQSAVMVGRLTPVHDSHWAEFLDSIYENLYWGTPLEAALYKHMLSSYLATMLTLGNEWKAAADALGIEHTASAWACLKEEPRISRHAPITPGPFDGSHLWRDVDDLPKSAARPLLLALADSVKKEPPPGKETAESYREFGWK